MTSKNSEEQTGETPSEEPKLDYEILSEEYPQYDLSFKIIVIGNSGKKYILLIKYYRRWEIMFINTSNETCFRKKLYSNSGFRIFYF